MLKLPIKSVRTVGTYTYPSYDCIKREENYLMTDSKSHFQQQSPMQIILWWMVSDYVCSPRSKQRINNFPN